MQPLFLIDGTGKSPTSSVYDLLMDAKGKVKDYSLIKTATNRYAAGVFGGPMPPKPGEHVSPEVFEFWKTVTVEDFEKAKLLLDPFLERLGVDSACQRRTRYYLKKLLEFAYCEGYLFRKDAADQVRFNRFKSSKKAESLAPLKTFKTTDATNPPEYSLGTHDTDYVEFDGERILANPQLNKELADFKSHLEKNITADIDRIVAWCKQVCGYFHRQQNIPLSDLTVELIIEYVQMRFTVDDFSDHEAFRVNKRGHLIDPLAAEQHIAMTEAMAIRTANRKVKETIELMESFIAWRSEVLITCGKPDGLRNTTIHNHIKSAIWLAKYLFRDETNANITDDFDDIPMVKALKLMRKRYPLDPEATKRRIRKERCISWPRAMKVVEWQRRDALVRFTDSRCTASKQGYRRCRLSQRFIAQAMQKFIVLGCFAFVPTDRQEVVREQRIGHTLKSGHFDEDTGDRFIEVDFPDNPNDATLWINLETFKTVEKYGEFWYPIPNVRFLDGTRFYEFLYAWLFGFEDKSGKWPTYYRAPNEAWQGGIDEDGNRIGWRTVLKPKHDYLFSMPRARKPICASSMKSLVRNTFISHTRKEGDPVGVTPHSLRHMLSDYLDEMGITKEELDSFSYVLHHTPEIHNRHYVYRNNQKKISHAVKRMNQLLTQMF